MATNSPTQISTPLPCRAPWWQRVHAQVATGNGPRARGGLGGEAQCFCWSQAGSLPLGQVWAKLGPCATPHGATTYPTLGPAARGRCDPLHTAWVATLQGWLLGMVYPLLAAPTLIPVLSPIACQMAPGWARNPGGGSCTHWLGAPPCSHHQCLYTPLHLHLTHFGALQQGQAPWLCGDPTLPSLVRITYLARLHQGQGSWIGWCWSSWD